VLASNYIKIRGEMRMIDGL